MNKPIERIPETADCDHHGQKDLTQGKGSTRNIICPKCKMHWYNGRVWTRKEWDEYVEDFWENFDKAK